jgi:hypothetical protein
MVSPRRTAEESGLPLAALLAKALFGFAIEFNRESDVPLALAANVLRVSSQEGVRVGDLPRLRGGSPETCAIGWGLKPYVDAEPDPGGRRTLARLTARGVQAQQTYLRLVKAI